MKFFFLLLLISFNSVYAQFPTVKPSKKTERALDVMINGPGRYPVYDNAAVIKFRQQWFIAPRSINSFFPQMHYRKVNQFVAQKQRLHKSFQSQTWVPVGPTAIVNTGDHKYSGRVIAVNVSPFDTNVVIIGAASGGIWKSADGGQNWSPKSDELGSLAVSCFARHPSDPAIIYAGTGEPSFNADAISGVGILKSTDGGENWFVAGNFPFPFTHIAGISVNKNNPNVVVVANYYNDKDNEANGIYRSTDGGLTWSATNILGTQFRPCSLTEHPANNDTLWTALGRTVAPNQNGIWKSTDAGASWFLIASGPAQGLPDMSLAGKSSISVCRDFPEYLYAIFSKGSDSQLLGLYKSRNGGISWSKTNLPDSSSASVAGGTGFFNGQGFYDIYVATHPADTNIVYAGGIDLYRTLNGGHQWQNISNGYTSREFHPDQQAFAFNPLNSNTIYLAGDGGMKKSYKGGNDLSNHVLTDLNSNLQITQLVGLAVAADDTNMILGGSQDNGTELRTENSDDWSYVVSGDGGFTFIDPTDNKTQYAQRNRTQGDPFSQIRTRSRWSSAVSINNGLNADDHSQFYVPYTLDESFPARLYLGSTRIYKTTNAGDSWLSVSSQLTSEGHTISILKVSRTQPDAVAAGTTDGRIWLSVDAGQQWNMIATSVLPQRPVGDIAFRLFNDETIYVTFQGFSNEVLQGTPGDNKGHVWKTNNRGRTWIDITGDLPDVPVNAIAADPHDTLHLIAGTDVGVFRTLDGGSSWTPFNNGFPSGAFVLRLVQHYATGNLFAGTYGRGAYKIPVFKSVELPPPGIIPTFSLEQNFPNPFNGTTTIEFYLPKQESVRIVIYNVLGQKIRTLKPATTEAGVSYVTWDGKDERGKEVASGLYIYRMITGSFTKTRKMLFIK